MTRWGWLLLGCLLPALAGAEEKLGRLFFTPAERVKLDYLRQTSKPPEKIVKGDEEAKEDEDVANVSKPAAPPVVSIGGYVKRSDGKTTVWVNGRPLQEKTAAKDFTVGKLRGDTNQVQIKLPRTGQAVSLKAGQSYDPVSGKVANSLRDLPQRQQEGTPATEEPGGSKEAVAQESPPDNSDAKTPPPPPAPSR